MPRFTFWPKLEPTFQELFDQEQEYSDCSCREEYCRHLEKPTESRPRIT
jgi:hypothetical protein